MATKLSNVIGAPFQDYVMTQLFTRAARNSTTNRTNDEVLFLANKTSWARFVSSVNIELTATELEKFYESLDIGPLAKNKDELARNWILEAGTSIQNGNGITLRQGIGINGAYGLGGTEELGYRPMPGLTSVNIETAGRLGSLRTATINFKVWNMNQLNVIEALYFRLGYSMLLEWGHTQYYKNNSTGGEFVRSDIYGIEDPFKAGVRKEAIQQAIARKSRATSGNYDGMLGIVSNFNWSFNQDGGYDCNVKIVGLGAVMDSLRINQTYKLPEGLVQQFKKAQSDQAAYIARLEKLAAIQAAALERAAADRAAADAAAKAPPPPGPEPKNIVELYDAAVKYDKRGKPDPNFTFGQFTSSYQFYPAPVALGDVRADVPDYYYESTAPGAIDRNLNNANYFGLFLQGQKAYWKRLPLNNTTNATATFTLNAGVFDKSAEFRVTNAPADLKKAYDSVGINYLTKKEYTFVGRIFYEFSSKVERVSLNPAIPSTYVDVPIAGTYNSGEFFFTWTRKVGPSGNVQNKLFRTTVSFNNPFANDYSLTRQQVLEAFDSWLRSGDPELNLVRVYTEGSGITQSLVVESSTQININGVRSTGLNVNVDPVKTIPVDFKITFNNTNYINAVGKKNTKPAETKPATGAAAASGDAGGTVNQAAAGQVKAASGYESALHAMLTFVKGIAQARCLKTTERVVPINLYDETNIFYKDGVLQDVLTTATTVSTNPNGVPFDLTKYGQKGFSSNLMVDGDEKGLGLFDLTPNVDFKKLCTAIVTKYTFGSDGTNPDITLFPVYIPLGYLLAFLNNMCLVYDSVQSAVPASSTSGKDKRPYIYIDFNPETNFCLTSPQQLSVDPKTCMIPVNETDAEYASMFPSEATKAIGSNLFKPTSQNYLSKVIVDAGLNFKTADPYQGKMMNILLNIDYLLDQANKFSAADPEHSVNLKPFLEQIMIDINKCLGNMNSFRVAYRDDSNTVQIQDDQWVPGLASDPSVIKKNQFISNQYASGVRLGELPVFGQQSLARQFQFKTNVSTKLGSMIAISAQAATGSINAKDHSDLSWLNRNFRDRYKPYIQDPSNGPSGANTKQINKTASQSNDVILAEEFNNHVKSVYMVTDLNQERITPAKNYLIERLSKVKSEDPITSAAPFIPADLEITIDGISGIIMGNAFTIPENRLPLSMRGSNGVPKVAFITTGLTHTIENNEWLTKIKGQMIKIREDLKYSGTATVAGVASALALRSSGGSGGSGGGGNLSLGEGYPYPGAMADVFNKEGKKIDGYSGALQVLSPDSVNTSNFSTKYYPGYKFNKGTSDIDLSKKRLTPLTEPEIIDDTTKNRFNIGKLATPTPNFVVHHTAGRGTADGVYRTFYARGLPAQYVIDRDGRIHRFMPDGALGWHAGNYNSRAIGVEVIADNDADVLQVQVEAAARLIQFLGYSKNQVVGHGEIAPPGKKEKTEGKTIVDYIKNNL